MTSIDAPNVLGGWQIKSVMLVYEIKHGGGIVDKIGLRDGPYTVHLFDGLTLSRTDFWRLHKSELPSPRSYRYGIGISIHVIYHDDFDITSHPTQFQFASIGLEFIKSGPIVDPAHTERTCSTPIDRSKIITFPVLNAACLLGDVCEHPGEPVTDIKEMKRQVTEQVDAVGTVEAEVDHKSIDLAKARVQSTLFRVNMVEDNPFDQPPQFPIPPGNFIAFADGYWVSLQPYSLSVGPHEIHFKGTVPVGEGFPDFVVDVTYHITIK